MTLLILSSYIAGVPHRVRECNTDISVLAVGDALHFVPDAANPYDPNAVQVWHTRTNQNLGFIPAEQTPVYHGAVAVGLTPVATITALPMARFKEIVMQATVELP